MNELEEVKLRQFFKNRSNCYADVEDVVQAMDENCFADTIKEWQAERMYSEEDMVESFMACWKANMPEGFECKLSFNEWFEQFKKK